MSCPFHDGQLRLSWSARSTLSSNQILSFWLLASSSWLNHGVVAPHIIRPEASSERAGSQAKTQGSGSLHADAYRVMYAEANEYTVKPGL
jgi:hypothetical protein